MNELKTIEDFKGNRIQICMLSKSEYEILRSVSSHDLEWFRGFGPDGAMWSRYGKDMQVERDESLVYRYNPEPKEV